MGKVDPEPPQRTGIILAFNDMKEFEEYVSLFSLLHELCMSAMLVRWNLCI